MILKSTHSVSIVFSSVDETDLPAHVKHTRVGLIGFCLFLITSLQFEEAISMSCQPSLLEWKVRSQDSPSIANALVVERVRRVKTFAQHATLGVLEVAYKKEIRGLINYPLLEPQCRFIILRANFSATGRQQILFST